LTTKGSRNTFAAVLKSMRIALGGYSTSQVISICHPVILLAR
jgi:hypothetical protein